MRNEELPPDYHEHANDYANGEEFLKRKLY